MIKSITTIRLAKNAAEFDRMAALFDALGFERGKGWREEVETAQSGGRKLLRGAPFLAPVGSIEFVDGEMPPMGDLLVEVTDLDTVYAQAKQSGVLLSEITPTHWRSRYFTMEPGEGIKVAFWSFDDPAKYIYRVVEGDLAVTGARFGIVVSRFNAFITERLLQGALDALHRSGTRDAEIEIVRVPGAFEIPIGARTLAQAGKVDAVICLGLLMRGETSNYEHISEEVARGIGQSAQETGVPHAYGVLTCDTLEQAIDRAGLKMGNKGFEAAISAVEMVSLARKLKP